jgi:hypothetical protein
VIQERILEVLRLLGCHSYFRLLGLFRPALFVVTGVSADAKFSTSYHRK